MMKQISKRLERLERARRDSDELTEDSLDILSADKLALSDCVRDPVDFTRFAFGHHHWGVQQQILRSVARNRRTAVKACHASGKTFCAADAVLWWITAHPDAIAITTAPTWTQVDRLLWGEIRKSLAVSTVAYPTPLKNRLVLAPERYAIGLSTNEGVRFQGWHGKILIVIDEAPGVRPDIYEAIEGIRAGGDVRILALGNPTTASGPFHDAFTVARDSWSLFTIGAFDTPNLQGLDVESLLALSEDELDRNVSPYLTTRRWVKEKYREWGPGHPLWESRVLGNFPTQSQDALFSLTWLEAAQRKTPDVLTDNILFTAGIDVAGPGEDETVLAIRRGNNIVEIRSFAHQDARGELAAALLPYQGRLAAVNVDTAGIGWYMAQHLADRFPVKEINVGQSPSNPERYVNLKAELYWGLRMRFEHGLAGMKDEKAIAQLAAMRYQHNARGQVVIESKDEARKRGVRSPDRAEALMLAFAVVVEPPQEGRFIYEERVRISPF